MDLDELLDGLLEPHAVVAAADGDRLVGLRLADDWGIGVRLHRRGTHRQWNVGEITLRLTDSGASISGNDVRELPLGALIAEARRLATKDAAPTTSTPVDDLAVLLAANDGRFGGGDDVHAALALAYVSLVESGDRAPSQSLAAALGGAAGSWTNRVAEARRRGFLTPVGRGEAGGALTVSVRELLGLAP